MNRKFIAWTIYTLAWLIMSTFVLTTEASAQEQPKVVITPIIENGSYSRTFTYDDRNAGYESTGIRSNTVQKGFAIDFRGDKHWSFQMRFTTGSVGTPTRNYRLTDGTSETGRPYNLSSNANIVYSANSRAFEMSAEYTRGFLSFRSGVAYRLLEQLDQTTIFGDFPSYSESEFVNSFLGPKFGISARPSFGRVTAIASVDVSPWMRHNGHYSFELRNWGIERFSRKTTASGFDADLGASLRLTKALDIVGGWKYSAINTANSNFLFPNPFGNNTMVPQKDSWRGVYVGLNTRF